jgi:hypothetical protein
MMKVYFPQGTNCLLDLECGHSDRRLVCGEFDSDTLLFCPECNRYRFIASLTEIWRPVIKQAVLAPTDIEFYGSL